MSVDEIRGWNGEYSQQSPNLQVIEASSLVEIYLFQSISAHFSPCIVLKYMNDDAIVVAQRHVVPGEEMVSRWLETGISSVKAEKTVHQLKKYNNPESVDLLRSPLCGHVDVGPYLTKNALPNAERKTYNFGYCPGRNACAIVANTKQSRRNESAAEQTRINPIKWNGTSYGIAGEGWSVEVRNGF
ncbi:hypothetical protein K503DRAFT_781279 [Rhizopogon vinicolor AM-OR11-026]|uniref:Uncharacterized protein n=1 Tax=Rhizopogon vinicolor AM-OR11-026 TaxID=1314800 RepID=A0A1B7N6V7_9AGAM|nr:hypothetical protein K503DRAFT_781279 [Rhizopogon vinicolor AM-OR11-026]